ncbi:MAG: hypothetical protein AB1643_00995 [Patescibacteria group bacterium]
MSKKTKLIIIATVVVLILLILALFFIFNRENNISTKEQIPARNDIYSSDQQKNEIFKSQALQRFFEKGKTFSFTLIGSQKQLRRHCLKTSQLKVLS